MKHKVKIIILSVLGVLLVGSSVAYAYSQKGTLISQKTEELPDGNTNIDISLPSPPLIVLPPS